MTTKSVFDILFRISQRCVSPLFTEEYGIIDNPQPPEAKAIGKVRERDVWLLSKCILPHCYSQWGHVGIDSFTQTAVGGSNSGYQASLVYPIAFSTCALLTAFVQSPSNYWAIWPVLTTRLSPSESKTSNILQLNNKNYSNGVTWIAAGY